jgi:hypothetical protein
MPHRQHSVEIKFSFFEAHMQNELFDLRDQAGDSVARAALWLGVRTSHLWNCEQGLARLTPEQDGSLRSFYLTHIAERMKQLAATLQADGEIHGANPARRKP